MRPDDWRRWLDRHLGWTIAAAIVAVTVVWLGAAIAIGPRVHVRGRLTIVATDGPPCLLIATDEAGTVWSVTDLPAGYAAVAESFDPRFQPGRGQITGPDGAVARYLDVVDVEGIPVPAASDDRCGFHPRVSVLALQQVKSVFGP